MIQKREFDRNAARHTQLCPPLLIFNYFLEMINLTVLFGFFYLEENVPFESLAAAAAKRTWLTCLGMRLGLKKPV